MKLKILNFNGRRSTIAAKFLGLWNSFEENKSVKGAIKSERRP